jgi:type I restriction enzyme M protein
MPVISTHALAKLYSEAHDAMRAIDGMQSQEAFDELLKFLLVRIHLEGSARISAAEFNSRPPSHYVFNALLAEALDARMIPAASKLKFDRFLSSERSLQELARIFSGTRLTALPYDIRSEAIKEFMTPDLRRGLGMFLTPDPVVRLLVDLLQPKADDRVLDPACGTGSFLLAAARAQRKQDGEKPPMKLVGIDKNPRMVLLAQMNLLQADSVEFDGILGDSLRAVGDGPLEPMRESFDIVLSNPPFGVSVNSGEAWLGDYSVANANIQQSNAKIPSEVLFVERCLQFLRPGGRLGIVLPRGVMTNLQLDGARTALGQMGRVESVVSLPPETFATTGTQTSTLILVVRKYPRSSNLSESRPIAFADVRNVGFDVTGRPRLGSELPSLAVQIRKALAADDAVGTAQVSRPLPQTAGFSMAGFLAQQTRKTALTKTLPLGEMVRSIGPGRTPRRDEYTSQGLFLVKVGNLTGNGISWLPRERNFMDGDAFGRLRNGNRYRLNSGDILLTAAAHTPDYIARKVDIVTTIPAHLKLGASFVGEVMRVEPDPQKVDPFLLLAYLRLPTTTERIQAMVRGQTAHLYADDLATLDVPAALLTEPPAELVRLANIIREESRIAEDLNRVAWAQEQIFATDRGLIR